MGDLLRCVRSTRCCALPMRCDMFSEMNRSPAIKQTTQAHPKSTFICSSGREYRVGRPRYCLPDIRTRAYPPLLPTVFLLAFSNGPNILFPSPCVTTGPQYIGLISLPSTNALSCIDLAYFTPTLCSHLKPRRDDERSPRPASGKSLASRTL